MTLSKIKFKASVRCPFQRNILEGSLNQFIRDIEQNGTLLYIGSFIPTLLTSSIRPIRLTIGLYLSRLIIDRKERHSGAGRSYREETFFHGRRRQSVIRVTFN